MLTHSQEEHAHRLRRAVDHLTMVEQAIDVFRRHQSKGARKVLGKAIAEGNKYPTSLDLIGGFVVANAMRDGVVALKEKYADDLAKLYNSRK